MITVLTFKDYLQYSKLKIFDHVIWLTRHGPHCPRIVDNLLVAKVITRCSRFIECYGKWEGGGCFSLLLSHPLTGSLSFSLFLVRLHLSPPRSSESTKRFAAAALRAAVWFDRPNFPGHLLRKLLCTKRPWPLMGRPAQLC